MKVIIMVDTANYASKLYEETKDLILKEDYKQIVLNFNNGEHFELNDKYYSIVSSSSNGI